jgi:hypothetical protein
MEQPNRSANVRAPIEWSPCSWVRKIAAIVCGATPRASSLLSISFAERPASTSTRVAPDSTTQALPPEPDASTETRTIED